MWNLRNKADEHMVGGREETNYERFLEIENKEVREGGGGKG